MRSLVFRRRIAPTLPVPCGVPGWPRCPVGSRRGGRRRFVGVALGRCWRGRVGRGGGEGAVGDGQVVVAWAWGHVLDGEGAAIVRVVAAVAHYPQQVEQAIRKGGKRLGVVRKRRGQREQHPPFIARVDADGSPLPDGGEQAFGQHGPWIVGGFVQIIRVLGPLAVAFGMHGEQKGNVG